MAKRTRGASRPGQRRPLQRSTRPAARPSAPASEAATAPRPTTLTPEEEARAAELEAQLVAEERQAEQAQKQTRDRQRSMANRDPVVRSSIPLSVREAEEYAYVARDVRRIATIAAGLLAIMIGLWIALQVSGVGAI
jgi:hypothetical protein